MFSRSLQKVMSKASLLVMIFASIAPTASYALASHNNPNLFQEICSSNGAKSIVRLQVLTTKGNQLSTGFDIKPSQAYESEPSPNNIGTHLEHCPYCASHIDAIATPNLSNATFVAELNAYQLIATYNAPLSQRFYQRANPPQAPPHTSID